MSKTAAKASNKTKTLPYDVAEQLRTPEEMAAYWTRGSPKLPTMPRGSRATSWTLRVLKACRRLRGTRGSAERACTRPSARTAIQALPRSSRLPVLWGYGCTPRRPDPHVRLHRR